MATSRTFKDLAQVALANYTGRDPSFPNRLKMWVDFFHDRDISSLTSDDIEDALDRLVARGKLRTTLKAPSSASKSTTRVPVLVQTGQPLAASTINRYLACMGTMFKVLKSLRLLPRGFVSPLRDVTKMPEGPGRTIDIDMPRVLNLVAACRLSRNRKLAALVAFACTTGWRLGSIQAMRWADVNLQDGSAYSSRTKNGTAHRTALLPLVIAELRSIKPYQLDANSLVFGKHNVTKAFRTALLRANLPTTWTFHHCRHIAASVLAQSGASVPIIMACLNHKSPQMALRYSHLNIDALRSSMERAWS